MRNQPLNSVFHDGETNGESLIDPPAEFRFRSLAVVFTIAVCIVLTRIAWVQARLQERYLAALNATSTEY